MSKCFKNIFQQKFAICMHATAFRKTDGHTRKKRKEKKKKKERGPCGACNMLFEIACSWIVSSAKTEAVPYWWQNITPTWTTNAVFPPRTRFPKKHSRAKKKFTPSWKWNVAVNSCWRDVWCIAIIKSGGCRDQVWMHYKSCIRQSSWAGGIGLCQTDKTVAVTNAT